MKHILDFLQQHLDEFVELRRDLHAHPELGLKEVRTADLLTDKLMSWGYEVTRGLAGTGLVAQLKRGTGSRRLGLRADMDALPILETTGLPYASRTPGHMHACGHDGHMAMLLAAARCLAQQGQFDGTLNLIFQPAEEGPGGAKLMIEDGLFERFPCDAVYAMHNMPGFPQGHLVFFDGPATASCDEVVITLHGTGGHGTAPHLAADPIIACASIVMALQTIVSRNVDPRRMAVVGVGAMSAGTASNVIPDTASLTVTVRALDREVRELLQRRICALVQAQAESFGVRAEVDYQRGYSVMVTTPAETALARQVGLALVGPERVTLQGEPVAGSEDFAIMLDHCPGSFLLIGNGAGENACMVHNPGYDFDDRNIEVGAAYWSLLAERFLQA
ncbi:M20 aminoacylase family protein [Rhodoferax sp.]|uniref:M20 aminoacylase family protein n=1 Tax=Rhodoferax sp. TaxID=50421 RepID=UPI0026154159|nr:M20 aminoacylase family protein [Rhodoferax sp.]MDD2924065.1 M20 family metallopeptidase [Rhodoferax sp.]